MDGTVALEVIARIIRGKAYVRKIEPSDPVTRDELTRHIRDFWSRNVNAERIMGKNVTQHARGEGLYFEELEDQRYRSHRHLLPWITEMQSGKSVLEIGSGIGLDTYTLARQGLEVVAIDLTQVGVATARQRFLRHKMSGSFAIAEAGYLPIADKSFDYVYSFGVLHHAADTEKTITEVHRVLKPGGEARIMLYHRRSINELVHRLMGVPFEDKDELCPVVRRFTLAETRVLFSAFRDVRLSLQYAYGEGYGAVFRWTPRWLYNLLSHHWGWHILIIGLK